MELTVPQVADRPWENAFPFRHYNLLSDSAALCSLISTVLGRVP